MLNFRYHVVSLVAVFLALGIGVIMGSAVIDSTTIDVLEAQEEQLRDEIDGARDRISELEGELGALREQQRLLAEQGSEVLLAGRLAGVPVVLVTPDGAGGDELDALTELVVSADAQLLGRVVLRDRLALEDDAARRDLAEVLGLPASTGPATLRRGAMEVLATLLGAASAVEGPVPPGAEPATPAAASTVAALADAGFVDVTPADGSPDGLLVPPPAATHALVVWEAADAGALERGLLLTRALAAADVPAVIAEGGADRDGETPSLVLAVRDDDALAAEVSTVDNLVEFAGRLAAVLALDAEGRGEGGHFGTGDGAQRILPPAPEPVAGGG